MDVLQPADEAEAAAMVESAAAAATAFAIRGHGTRTPLHPDIAAATTLDLRKLTGITLYDPAELVLAARAATPLAEVNAALAAKDQWLAFDPPDFGPLWGRPAGLGTLGGALAVGLGGPRRPRAGAPRDHLLGLRAINGAGQCFVSGGRVVKNVTGFDLCKVMAGSYGALGVLTELTLKVLPRPSARLSLVIAGQELEAGLAILREAFGDARPLTAGAYLPAALAARVGIVGAAERALTVLAVEGVPPAVQAAIDALGRRHPGQCLRLESQESMALWAALGGASMFAELPGPVVRISVPPTSAARVAHALRALGCDDFYVDWFGGLVVARLEPRADALAGARRALLAAESDSHVTVIRRGQDGGAFHRTSAGVARLSRRLKDSLDPKGLFNPGCLPGVD